MDSILESLIEIKKKQRTKITTILGDIQAQLQKQFQLQKQLQFQLQQQQQKQAQSQNDTDTISNVGNPTLRNIGNPTVNVNVSGGFGDLEAGKLVEFKSFVQNSINSTGLLPNTPLAAETTVAQVTLDDVEAGNQVLLNGLFFVDNDNNAREDLRVRIYKNAIAPANLIYDAPSIEIDAETRDDENQPIPVLHVDQIGSDATNVRYILTAQGNLFLRGPITFTASEIR
ncbi:hypothetical protein LS684_02565 [Cytobacillus spongiae]|jgi:hypothetical protein|uniref:hypothetical protein n=1 Tax=Cytobacillus spongiae TaxID=2901381 RepID=UPI001F4626E5|nr:hypothetical protein [Cytobacillus spongiae]UII56389.1 hypothetical protein LS684_02565 [Cytobacillus spongiae]